MGNTNVNKMENTNNNTMVSNTMIFEGHNVGIIEVDGEVLFEIYSTGMALGYARPNTAGTVYPYKSRIDKVLENAEISTCEHGVHKFITEEQLYDFMLEARTEKCKAFRKWVTSEVLPTIRKTGGMIVEGREEEFVMNYFPSFSEEVKLSMVQDLLKKNKELKPKADYCDRVLLPVDKNNGFTKLLTVTDIAKDLGMSARKLNIILKDLGVIYKPQGKNKSWCLYSKYQHLVPEYADYHISEHGQTLKFTEKGRKWLIETLEDNGYSFSNDNI